MLRCAAVLLLATLVLGGTAWLRSAEYDEQYTLFLTAGVARPAWPETPFAAGEVRLLQAGHAGLAGIARDLRRTDVHPPLYFWQVALWRRLVGGSLFAARLLSVLYGVAALAAVGWIAMRVGVAPEVAMLLTLGCYGFAYTATIARGFALAQLLTLLGVAVLAGVRRPGWMPGLFGGLLLGAATATNYLTVFVGFAVLAHGLWLRRVSGGWTKVAPLAPVLGFALCLPLDLWFFLAQRNSRLGQFQPFNLAGGLHRLLTYSAANLVGGLPLYAAEPVRPLATIALGLLLVGLFILTIRCRHHIGMPHARSLLTAAMLALPIGLLLLGFVFNTTPIELRYLAFAVPYAVLLLAGALAGLPLRPRFGITALIILVQASALAGLCTRAETMQPARAAAAAVTRLAGNGLVLLPRGNDGVGIVGSFAIEVPPDLQLVLAAIIHQVSPTAAWS